MIAHAPAAKPARQRASPPAIRQSAGGKAGAVNRRYGGLHDNSRSQGQSPYQAGRLSTTRTDRAYRRGRQSHGGCGYGLSESTPKLNGLMYGRRGGGGGDLPSNNAETHCE